MHDETATIPTPGEPNGAAPGVAAVSQPDERTSLASIQKTMDGRAPLCARGKYVVLWQKADPTSVIVVGCSVYRCATCGPRKARQLSYAMSYVASQHKVMRAFTLSLAPSDPEKRRQKMADLMRWCKKKGYACEWMWTTEQGSKTGMIHIHLMQWGDFIPVAELRKRWGAFVWLEKIRGGDAGWSKYMLGMAGAWGDYMLGSASGKGKKGSGEGDYQKWLELNNGRPMRWSRNFTGGISMEEAIKRGKALVRQEPEVEWELADLWTTQEVIAKLKASRDERAALKLYVGERKLSAERAKRARERARVGGDDLEVHLVGATAVVTAPADGAAGERQDGADGPHLVSPESAAMAERVRRRIEVNRGTGAVVAEGRTATDGTLRVGPAAGVVDGLDGLVEAPRDGSEDGACVGRS